MGIRFFTCSKKILNKKEKQPTFWASKNMPIYSVVEGYEFSSYGSRVTDKYRIWWSIGHRFLCVGSLARPHLVYLARFLPRRTSPANGYAGQEDKGSKTVSEDFNRLRVRKETVCHKKTGLIKTVFNTNLVRCRNRRENKRTWVWVDLLCVLSCLHRCYHRNRWRLVCIKRFFFCDQTSASPTSHSDLHVAPFAKIGSLGLQLWRELSLLMFSGIYCLIARWLVVALLEQTAFPIPSGCLKLCVLI